MRTFATLAVLCLTTFIVQGQESREIPNTVKTTGTAEVKVTPDQAVMLLGVERQSESAKSAKAAVTSTSRKILASLKALNIEDKDVQTAYLYLQPMIDYRKGVRITNFTAEQSLSVTIRDLSKLDAVMDAVIYAGANQIGGLEYQSGDLRKYEDQARDEAARAAREKANALASALGNQLGKTYSIEEVREAGSDYTPMAGYAPNVMLQDDKSRAPSTAPGELTVKATVTVSFDLL